MKNDIYRVRNCHLAAKPLTPLSDRIAKEKPELREGIEKLKELLGTERFEKYISPLQNIAKNETTLLVIAGNMLERSAIERECIPALKEAFAVRMVKVVG